MSWPPAFTEAKEAPSTVAQAPMMPAALLVLVVVIPLSAETVPAGRMKLTVPPVWRDKAPKEISAVLSTKLTTPPTSARTVEAPAVKAVEAKAWSCAIPSRAFIAKVPPPSVSVPMR